MLMALSLIWMAALAMVLLSFGTLSALIILRLHRERMARLYPDRRARISKALLHFAVANGDKPMRALPHGEERKMLMEAALDAARILRGASKQRLVGFLLEIRLDALLRRQARGGRVRDRISAIEALCLFPSSKTIATLHRGECSSDLRVWLAALRARVELGAGPDLFGLLELAQRQGAGKSPILQGLVEARVAENFEEALYALRSAGPGRALVVRALGESGRFEAVGPLRAALCHPEPEVRAAAAGALGALGYADAADALVRATRDFDWRVRLRAADAIGKLGLWLRADCLQPLLNDPVWWVRHRAEGALRRLGEAGAGALRHMSSAMAASRASAPAQRAG